jgi:hypothetical protein
LQGDGVALGAYHPIGSSIVPSSEKERAREAKKRREEGEGNEEDEKSPT